MTEFEVQVIPQVTEPQDHAMSVPSRSTLTRRTFLSTCAVGAGTLLLHPPALRAADAGLKEISFLVVSDTHVGYRKRPSAAIQWEKTAAELDRLPGEFILHLGDIVDAGQEDQYPIYLKTREKIGKPIHEIGGNHDPADLFEKYISKPADRVLKHQWLRIVLLNNARRDSHDGFLSEAQLDLLERECAAADKAGQYVIVAMHVPAHHNLHPDRGWYVKPDHGQTRLYEILEANKARVLGLFHGHFHNGIRGWDDRAPVHEIVFPSALYNLDRGLMKKKAAGYNLPEFRPGVTQVTLSAGVMKLQYKPIAAEATASRECETPQTRG